MVSVPRKDANGVPLDGIAFHPYYTVKDIVGVVVFLVPVCVFLAWNSWDFVLQSWRIGEASRDPGGLPYPFLPLLKSALLLMPLTVALQGVSLFLRSLRALRDR